MPASRFLCPKCLADPVLPAPRRATGRGGRRRPLAQEADAHIPVVGGDRPGLPLSRSACLFSAGPDASDDRDATG